MAVEFQAPLLELVQRGATATLLLDAQQMMSDACVAGVLHRIDHHVTNETLTPDRALGLCHELAAFRRIVARQKAEITRGANARRRLEDDAHAE